MTRQNIQARIRGLRMWSLSNSLRGLWIQTSNMSEKAVGYTTIGGDMMGSYSRLPTAKDCGNRTTSLHLRKEQ